ncbi:SbcC/MukB-like Walker B domain-containing protein [Panacagrimonas sp.]|uniref:SbcC/MukB-like Walker B domain-containing protein n=1 Tax=Panacagrimonas sp. TaxID=2480088 RepID=UPI003B51C581
MKQLVRLIMVNWWLFEEPEVVEFDEQTLIYGANGAGKSSILDAIQTLYAGADSSKLKFNQRADEKSKRTLKSYCLGVASVRPEEGVRSADLEPRDSALTHLVMTFQDEAGVSYNAGLLLSATTPGTKAEVELRYLLTGPAMEPADLVDVEEPLDKAGLQAGLETIFNRAKRDTPKLHPFFKVCATAEEFRRHLAGQLSGAGGVIESDRMLKAFLAALHFKPESNIDGFIRNQILSPAPMDLTVMKRSISDYRTIRRKIEETTERLDSLKKIDQLYSQATQASRDSAQFAWASAEFRVLMDGELSLRAEEYFEKARDAADEASKRALKKATQLDGLRKDKQALQTQLGHAGATQVATAQAELKLAEGNLSTANREVMEALKIWNQLHRLKDGRQMPQRVSGPLDRLVALGQMWLDQGMPTQQEVIGSIAAVSEGLAIWKEGLDGEWLGANAGLQNVKTQLTDVQDRIARAQGGSIRLPEPTMTLLRALASKSIEALPVSTLIEVRDEDWRTAIEAYLGGRVFSLIVSPREVNDAVRLFKSLGREGRVSGARVFDTSRTEQFLKPSIQSDSVVTLLRTDNRDAKAWIHRVLGGIRIAADEYEQREKGRSLTIEGLFYDGAEFTHPPRQPPALGRGAAAVLLPKLVAERETLVTREKQLAATVSGIKTLQEQVQSLATLIDTRKSVYDDMASAISARSEVRSAKATLDAMLTPEIKAITDRLATIDSDITAVDAELNRLNTAAATAANVRGDREREFVAAQTQVAASEQARKDVEETPGLDRTEASERLERLRETSAERVICPEKGWPVSEVHTIYADAMSAARKRSEQLARDAEGRRNSAATAIGEHRVKYGLEIRTDESSEGKELWIAQEINRILIGELQLYEAESRNAEIAVGKAIRGDFTGHLILARKEMKRVIDERNSQLSTRVFSNGERYELKAKPNNAFPAISDWLTSIAAQDESSIDDAAGRMDLFSNEKFKDAQAAVMKLIEETGDQAPEKMDMTDYRAYYSFDMLVSSPHGGKFSVQERLSSASGGERFTPLYIAVATALVGAYRIEQRGTEWRKGASLAMFDEAFNNLDVDNIDSCMSVLLGSGLQLIIACPDEKEPTLRPYVDVRHEMIKDGGAVVIRSKHLKKKGQEMLRGAFPAELHRNPDASPSPPGS